jgi:hypothetical protein
MTDLSDLNKDTPAKQNDTVSPHTEEELAHRRVEREAMKGAKRAEERQHKDDSGEFSNIGPV